MQKHVNLVDLVKSFPTNIYLQNLASIQKRTSPVKSAHLAEKSGKGSISNLSTKPSTNAAEAAELREGSESSSLTIRSSVVVLRIPQLHTPNECRDSSNFFSVGTQPTLGRDHSREALRLLRTAGF